MSCIYKPLFQIGLYFELKMCKKCWLFMRMNNMILIFFEKILRIFQISNISLCGTFHNSKKSSKLVWNYQNVFTLLGEALKSKNGLHFWHHFLFKIKFYGLHGHWKVWIRKINLIFEHNSIYQWRIGLCTYSSSYLFLEFI